MKKFLISVVVVLLLAILSIAGFIYTFDANKYKNEVAEAVSEIVGRQVEILGDVDISIYPWIGVTLNNLTIENNTDFSNKSFATVGKFDINIQIMPLLEDHLEIDKLVLHQLSVDFVSKAEGNNNWSDLFGVSENDDFLSRFGVKTLKIAGIELTDSNVSWLEVASGKQYQISKLSVKSQAVIKGKPVPVSINAYIRSNQPEWQASISTTASLDFNDKLPVLTANNLKLKAKAIFPGEKNNKFSFAMITDANINYQTATAKLSKTKFSILGLVFSGNLDIENLFSVPTIKGPLKVKPFEAAKLARRFDIEIPALSNEQSLKNISLKTMFSTNFNYFYLDEIYAKVDESLVKGFVRIENFTEPAVNYELGIDKLALHDYRPVAKDANAKESLLPLELIRSTDLEGVINIEKMTVDDVELSSFHIVSQLKDGVIKANPVTAWIDESEIKAALLLDARKQPLSKLTLKAVNVDAKAGINPLLKTVTGNDALLMEGVLSIDANINSNGLSWSEHKKTAKGSVSFNMVDGIVQGLDIDHASRSVVADYANKNNFRTRVSYVPEYITDRKSVVKTLHARFDAANGKFSNSDFKLLSDDFSLTGSGSIDFINNRLDYRPVVDVKVESRVDIRDKLRDHPMEYHVYGDFEKLKTEFEVDRYELLVGRLLLQESKRKRIQQLNKKKNGGW